MRLDVNCNPVFFARRERGRRVILANPHRGVGLTLHRDGGLSVVGYPAEGGTTIAWGRCLKVNMLKATNCIVRRFGPVKVYSGEDF